MQLIILSEYPQVNVDGIALKYHTSVVVTFIVQWGYDMKVHGRKGMFPEHPQYNSWECAINIHIEYTRNYKNRV